MDVFIFLPLDGVGKTVVSWICVDASSGRLDPAPLPKL